MFKIRDGRDYFYQWDVNREILVEDETITQVHFCNRTDDCSLVVEVKEIELFADNKLIKVERYAEVPNILLQDNWKIRIYAYCGSKYTKVEQVFNVKSRSKPSDYVYTETEVLTYHQLEKRLDEIEEKGFSEDVVNNAVNEYFENNPIVVPEPDLSNYYDKGEVDTLIDNVEVDLTGYATEDYVQKEIAEAQLSGGDVDLSNYYTKSETNTQIDNKIDKIVIPTVPTNVSAFTNDAKYVNEQYVKDEIKKIDIPDTDLSNYYTKEQTNQEIDKAIDNLEIPNPDLSNYYTKSETYNKNEVDQIVDDIDIGDITIGISDDGSGNVNIQAVEGGEVPSVDLTNYYTKEETNQEISNAIGSVEVPTSVSQLINDKGYLTSVPDEYVTELELNGKGYVSSSTLDSYATQEYVDSRTNGQNNAVVFASYGSMINSLQGATNDVYKVGQNIYIQTLNVPDLWVSSIETSKNTYTYMGDKYVEEHLSTNGYIQVGYYKLSALESQKVDLSEYVKSSELGTAIGSSLNGCVDNRTDTTLNLWMNPNTMPYTNTIYRYYQPISTISRIDGMYEPGAIIQFKTASSVVCTDTSPMWIGDDCKNYNFTPQPDTYYEVHSHSNNQAYKSINMVINLGSLVR